MNGITLLRGGAVAMLTAALAMVLVGWSGILTAERGMTLTLAGLALACVAGMLFSEARDKVARTTIPVSRRAHRRPQAVAVRHTRHR